ncbi:MAG TPA: superoxide dismutase [Bacteroidales bacterium]|nr:superoxide dismutase [Bacteroidales bacterium]
MTHELPKLPYELDALAPVISKQTLEYHYGKHHQAYVNNLNNLIVGTKFENADLESIIRESDGGVFNNAAQIWNHTFYFNTFSPKPQLEPSGKLAEMIVKDFGSLGEFKEKFNKAAATLFGAGWAWLVLDSNGHLEIKQESNAGTPLKHNLKPLITCDVWEHAYYLDYQNRRPDYINTIWNVIDWKVVESRL